LNESEISIGNISDVLRARCGTWDDEVQSKVDTCSFWMEGVILTITGKMVKDTKATQIIVRLGQVR
jgi:hypothetical protein